VKLQIIDELGYVPLSPTGAELLLDRLTHHVSILTMNGDSYRLKQSAGRRRSAARAEQNQATEIIDPETGEITTA
jgi:DNA replication protein DnaC